MASKQSNRRRLASVSQALLNQPMAMDVRVMSRVTAAVESGDTQSVDAILGARAEDCPSTATIRDGLAIIPVSGPLRDQMDWMVKYYGASSYQCIERDVKAAIDNTAVKAVVLFVDSPGGSAIGVKRCADYIKSLRGRKPIVAYVQGAGCSAAYYLAASTDKIFSTADSIVGSIGTIYTHTEISKLAKDIGYGFTVITNSESPKKGHGNMYEPLGDAAKKTLSDYVDSYGKAFIADVASYRKITPANVVEKYGQGDAFVATEAKSRGMVDAIVANFGALSEQLTGTESQVTSTSEADEDDGKIDPAAPPVPEKSPEGNQQASAALPTRILSKEIDVKKLKAQLFAMGLVDSTEASDELANAAIRGYCNARGVPVPASEAEQLAVLQSGTTKLGAVAEYLSPAKNVADAHDREFAEARKQGAAEAKAEFADLKAAADLFNDGRESPVVSADMVAEAFGSNLSCKEAIASWSKKAAEQKTETEAVAAKIKHVKNNSDQFGIDAASAVVYRATNGQTELSDAAGKLVNQPLWALGAQALKLSGEEVDMFGDRELIAERAMAMGGNRRHVFFSEKENRQYIGADGIPYTRPGDFPHILSAIANKYLDTIELDDYSFEKWTAVLPGGLKDFRPTSMINKGIPDELDVLKDAEELKEIGMQEEILSYVFLQRFGNKFGWTPVMVANDDLGAFAEGMLGLDDAWMTTQNRLCLDLLTGNPTLLDGQALFRTANDVTSGSTPSDTQWAAMETKYADITGVGGTRRVRGSLNVIFVPTGTAKQEAVRTFAPLNGLEPKMAATTANVGLYRGDVEIVSEGDLRAVSTTKFYGFRNPRNIRTATVIRGYFGGFGTMGRRERWYDADCKTTWISLEGRVGAAIKNWRYAVRNAGA